MRTNLINTQTIHALMRPLVLSGIYKSEADALQSVVYDFINQKIAFYKKQSDAFETKYKLSFETFSSQLTNNSTMESDDDWFEWKAAIEMSKSWTASLKLLGDENRH